MTWLGDPTSADVAASGVELLLGLRDVPAWPLGWAVVLALIAVVATASRADARRAILFVSWLAVPTLGSLVVSWALTPIFQTKHWLVALPAVCVLLGVVLVPLARRTGWATVVAVLALAASPGLYAGYATYEKQDWRGLVRYVAEHRQPGDVLFLNPGASSTVVSYYLGQYRVMDLALDGYPRPYDPELGPWFGESATRERVAPRVDALASERQRVWLVQFSRTFWDPEGQIEQELRARAVEEPVSQFSQLGLALYRLTR
jgi:hypothetical protein